MTTASTLIITCAGVGLIWAATWLALRKTVKPSLIRPGMDADEFTAAMHRRIQMERRQAK